jgi:sn-glycerol 3-phosphate transport system permease protein
MVERTPFLNIATHLILIVGFILTFTPIYLVFIASTLTMREVNQVPLPIIPGDQFWTNVSTAWTRIDMGVKLLNSLAMAIGVASGKIFFAALSAFSIVFFRYRMRMVFFWLIFITLMLPLEVRIVPTYAVAANALRPWQEVMDAVGLTWLIETASGVRVTLEWGLLNSYTGLVLPLVATATGTFLYRQFFLTIPDELTEAAKMDGARPLRFFIDILLPLSRTNMAALFTIMFIYAWNQYLWPVLVTTDPTYGTVIKELKRLMPTFGGSPEWHVAMAGTLVAMLPPLIVVALMQKWFIRGLIASDK